MLVDINLLPQKEKKRSWGLITILIGLIIVGVFFLTLWLLYHSQLRTVEQLNRELTINQELRKVYEDSQSTQATTPTEELEQAVKWVESNHKETYILLEHLTALLPERGFIQNYSYESLGTLSLSVQFDSTRQAADFLNHLRASSYMKSVDLQSVSTIELEEDILEDDPLPRYIANFSIELNVEKLLTTVQEKEETS